ncbi:MAG: hydrogenase formation protein HypD [Bacillota bacterium]|nr:hydrogenase formation protein HypD [Bacillota bacterium]
MDIEDLKRKLAYINCYTKEINIMEVCGTHTMSIGKNGIRDLLSPNINLLSGPGCPVCVTPDHYIDYIYDLALNKECIIATYGDMIRVPGSTRSISLEKAKAFGADVRMVYSSMDAVRLARQNHGKKVVFLGIGFETTTPATAIAIKEAEKSQIHNFYVLSMHKRIEPVMRALLEDKDLRIDAFLCPGHVAVIIGEDGFKFLEEYNCVSAIAGFETEEIIDGLYFIVKDLISGGRCIKNAYGTLVSKEGNNAAKEIIGEVFESRYDYWRGLGMIESSGYKLKASFKDHDIEALYPVNNDNVNKKDIGCRCGEVLKGKIKPEACILFGKTCTPESPVGPCMVSGEGSCAARFRYGSY